MRRSSAFTCCLNAGRRDQQFPAGTSPSLQCGPQLAHHHGAEDNARQTSSQPGQLPLIGIRGYVPVTRRCAVVPATLRSRASASICGAPPGCAALYRSSLTPACSQRRDAAMPARFRRAASSRNTASASCRFWSCSHSAPASTAHSARSARMRSSRRRRSRLVRPCK